MVLLRRRRRRFSGTTTFYAKRSAFGIQETTMVVCEDIVVCIGDTQMTTVPLVDVVVAEGK